MARYQGCRDGLTDPDKTLLKELKQSSPTGSGTGESSGSSSDAQSESKTCSLPVEGDRNICQAAYEVCSTDASYRLTSSDGGDTADTLAVRYANATFGSSTNPDWQVGYGGCFGALLAQYDRFHGG